MFQVRQQILKTSLFAIINVLLNIGGWNLNFLNTAHVAIQLQM